MNIKFLNNKQLFSYNDKNNNYFFDVNILKYHTNKKSKKKHFI